MTKNNNLEVYKTNNIYESSFLVALGFQFNGSEETNGNNRYVDVIFKDSPELQKAVLDFNNNAPVPILTFINSYKRVKETIFRRNK